MSLQEPYFFIMDDGLGPAAWASPQPVVKVHHVPSSTPADGYRDVALLSTAPDVA